MRDYAFGDSLSALRQEHGYSQFQLASLVGVSDKAVSKWETGVAKPRRIIIMTIELRKIELPILSNTEQQSRASLLWQGAV